MRDEDMINSVFQLSVTRVCPMRRKLLVFLAFLIAASAATWPAQARVQRDMVCWVPDCEFPVDCDEEDE